MKKLISSLLVLIILVSGCASNTPTSEDEKIKIVTTTFPQYDWVKEITKDTDNIELTLLINSGVDLHSFQPSAQDILNISTCDMFIYVGGESDEWVEDALKEKVNQDMVTISLLDVLGSSAKVEEEIEGMEENDHEHEEEHEEELDEHVWLSLKNAQLFCDVITEEIKKLDPDNSSTYDANLASYKEKLVDLDNKYSEAISNANTKTVLFGDRFPFRYLFDDYGLSYYAAFKGCSAETEASFETIVFLANKVDELNLQCVMNIEGTTHKIAQTIVENTSNKNQKILLLDSMQSITNDDIDKGVTYLSVTESNLEVLKEALK